MEDNCKVDPTQQGEECVYCKTKKTTIKGQQKLDGVWEGMEGIEFG
jgi:hypothetical protein